MGLTFLFILGSSCLALFFLVQLSTKRITLPSFDYSPLPATETLKLTEFCLLPLSVFSSEGGCLSLLLICSLFLIICEFEDWKWMFQWCRGAGCGSEWSATARSWRRRRLLCMTVKLGFGELMLKEGSFLFF